MSQELDLDALQAAAVDAWKKKRAIKISPYVLDNLIDRLRKAEAAREGWRLVPIEPTKEMWAAVNKLDDEMAAGSYDGRGCSIEQAWNSLLAAAPDSTPTDSADSEGAK